MPEDKLEKVIDAVEKAVKDKSPKKEKKSTPWGWLTGIFVAAIGMILIAGLSWWLSRKGRELAKLKHERDVREAQAHVDKINAHIEKNADKTNQLVLRAAKKKIEAEIIDRDVKELEKAEKAIKDQIDAIKDWDGVDRFLAGDSGDSTN
jgi:uncharacterized protein HemX